ncbi:von Willebrand factor A [Methanosarcina sp. 1.H.T.1A.1]|uniref:vWA domain-containing protein n=1 Tax=unclassified Methanosarcina TaxID=2644672 RepID=UPI0006215E2A|nr:MULTISPECIES: VWA domain-containing protein [unclassified Methanosarcina]KKH45080.1 von Willebrand factor A [Methanosarcina sp. 1.H.A.2.2]KKH92344.1 von Willebrand factor A [Methanosarcina sp. 1.H.T.1A.1]
MLNESNNKVILKIIGAAVVVFILVYLAITIIGPGEGSLDSVIKDINVNTVQHPMGHVVVSPDLDGSLTENLPEISKYQPQVNNSTPTYIEIFSSTEKAGSGADGWLTEVARDFNSAAITIDGKQVSVRLRGIPSGEAADYITSGKYLPDAYTPSNELWGEMIISKGVKAELVQERLAGNVAGILLTKSKKDELVTKHEAINTKTITDAVANKELAMGYTNPFASSTGLNFLISTLYTFDSSNLLSDKAKTGFESFQANIPVVAYTTLQMRESAKSGVLDGFVLEYQTYVNTPDIGYYEFTPFGFRHDSPMYAIGELSAEKRKILNEFVEFSQQEKYQTLATEYGFNGFNEYQSETGPVSGDVIIQAQKLWKEKKKPICAVFVADVSGSMMGDPLNNLKDSLLKGQYYIGEDNMVGLVSYSSDVNIDLPIARFDLNQRASFVGAVNDLQAVGGTATFDGIAVAMKMIQDQRAVDPNLRPVIFVLSDGETNEGHSLNDVEDIVEDLGIPIYTIGYNANLPALQAISSINEAASINADTDDVVYKLGNLFNAEM